MTFEGLRTFHVLSNGEVKEVEPNEYLKMLGKKGYLVGWIGEKLVLLHKGGSDTIMLKLSTVQQIEHLWLTPKIFEAKQSLER